MLEVDGSFGEGGGQILRTSLSLSCLLGKPFRIYNIRRGRSRPGLMPAHITAVRAAAEVCGAEIEGASKGSPELVFRPGRVGSGDFSFDIGTAGSTSLVLQTLLPPLAFSGGASTVAVRGGTHVPFCPTFDYLSEVFVPLLRRIGLSLTAEIESYGFYPRGGGRVLVSVEPCPRVSPVDLTRRGGLLAIEGVSAVAGLPLSIARRQREAVLESLGDYKPEIDTKEVGAFGQGTYVFLKARYEGAICGFSSLGARGKRAEVVGEEAAAAFLAHHRSGSCLDPHMADQIVLYLALADGESRYTTSEVTGHLSTNLHVISKFMEVESQVAAPRGVSVRGRGTGQPGLPRNR
ncbi:MAG: RNA 3'-terminal phosphate cyclase [Nitrospirota bacterium]